MKNTQRTRRQNTVKYKLLTWHNNYGYRPTSISVIWSKSWSQSTGCTIQKVYFKILQPNNCNGHHCGSSTESTPVALCWRRNDIFETLPVPDPGETDSVLEVAVKALTNYFMPKQNPIFQEYKFRNAKQAHGEPLITFYTCLKQLSLTSEFTDVDRAIKTQIIQQGISHRLQRKALADPSIILEKLLETGKAMELADAQALNLENKPNSTIETANQMTHAQSPRNHQTGNRFK